MSDDFVSLLNEPSLTPEKFSQPSKIIQFPINQIKVGSRFRDDVGDLAPLIESIKEPLEKMGMEVEITERTMSQDELQKFFKMEQEKWKGM